MPKTEQIVQSKLFVSGKGGYTRYRIPALAVSVQGTILAFCEARKFTGHDSDQIDLFLRRSFDNGATFEEAQMITTEEGWVCGNPAPVVDRETGAIWLLFCKNREHGPQEMICEGKAPRTVWITSSNDDGATWAEPQEITASVKRPGWTWYGTGPCHGIQLGKGRLIVPSHHVVVRSYGADDPLYSHILYSDDHGESWQIGGATTEGVGECTVVEATDGRIYFNCRNRDRLPEGGNFRAVAWSEDGGQSFSAAVPDPVLLEPCCQASVCRFTDERQHDRNRVVFSNPAARTRHQMTIRLSYDECRTWPIAKVLHAGPTAYSDLCIARDLSICCLYECGVEHRYETITLARFGLEWLTNGEDRLG